MLLRWRAESKWPIIRHSLFGRDSGGARTGNILDLSAMRAQHARFVER